MDISMVAVFNQRIGIQYMQERSKLQKWSLTQETKENSKVEKTQQKNWSFFFPWDNETLFVVAVVRQWSVPYKQK